MEGKCEKNEYGIYYYAVQATCQVSKVSLLYTLCCTWIHESERGYNNRVNRANSFNAS